MSKKHATAGKPRKFKTGIKVKRLQILVPIEKSEQVKNCIETICADELNN